MPIPPFSEPQGDVDDSELLVQFVHEVREALNYIAQNRVEGGIGERPVIEARAEALMAAWDEATPFFDQLEQRLGEITLEEVEKHGLDRAQLRFKLGNVAYWSSRVNSAVANQRRDAWFNALIRLLFSIGSLLESVLDATGFGTALKEVLNAIRDVVEPSE